METQYLTLSDHLLYAVFGCCGVSWQYMFPDSSPGTQASFDENFGKCVMKICRQSWNRMEIDMGQPLLSSNNPEELFCIRAECYRAMFPSDNQSFLLMVHVAMLAAFFTKGGIASTSFWAFEIIKRHAKQYIVYERTVELTGSQND